MSLDYFLLARSLSPSRRLPAQLPWFDPDHEVLEVGPSTGNLTLELAHDGLRVLACEPDDTSRAVLIHRITMDSEVRDRVSVLPLAFQEAPLPERLGGALLSHVLFYLDAEDRAQLWDELAQRLPAGAGALVSRAWPTTADPVERRLLGDPLRLGRFTYRRWFSSAVAEGAPVPSMAYTNTFEMRDGDHVVHTEESVEVRPVLTEADAIEEMGPAFEVELLDDGWIVATRR